MKSETCIDEKIIQLQRFFQNSTKSYNLLTDEISIRGKRVRFTPILLFDGRVSAFIPEHFIAMPEPIAKIRYVSSYRPPVILTSTRYDENIAFHLLKWEDAGENAQLDRLIQQMHDTVRLHAPETVVYDKGSIFSESLEGRWFEYKNFTLDEETYNLQFLVHSGSYLLAGTFNCRMVFYDEWKAPVLKSLEYIKTWEKGKQTDEG